MRPAREREAERVLSWDARIQDWDVVDAVDLFSLGQRDHLRQPRGGDPEVARRLGERETGLGHQAHHKPGPHGREPAAASPHLQLLRANPRLLTLRAHDRHRLAEPGRPGALALESGVPFRQQLLEEGAGAEDAWVDQDPGRPPANRSDLGLALHAPEKPAASIVQDVGKAKHGANLPCPTPSTLAGGRARGRGRARTAG